VQVTKTNSTDDIYGLTAYGAIRKAGTEASILGFRSLSADLRRALLHFFEL